MQPSSNALVWCLADVSFLELTSYEICVKRYEFDSD